MTRGTQYGETDAITTARLTEFRRLRETTP